MPANVRSRPATVSLSGAMRLVTIVSGRSVNSAGLWLLRQKYVGKDGEDWDRDGSDDGDAIVSGGTCQRKSKKSEAASGRASSAGGVKSSSVRLFSVGDISSAASNSVTCTTSVHVCEGMPSSTGTIAPRGGSTAASTAKF